jgi:hypothetical protein
MSGGIHNDITAVTIATASLLRVELMTGVCFLQGDILSASWNDTAHKAQAAYRQSSKVCAAIRVVGERFVDCSASAAAAAAATSSSYNAACWLHGCNCHAVGGVTFSHLGLFLGYFIWGGGMLHVDTVATHQCGAIFNAASSTLHLQQQAGPVCSRSLPNRIHVPVLPTWLHCLQVWSTIHVLIHNCKDPMTAAQVEASRALAVWLRQVRPGTEAHPGCS